MSLGSLLVSHEAAIRENGGLTRASDHKFGRMHTMVSEVILANQTNQRGPGLLTFGQGVTRDREPFRLGHSCESANRALVIVL